MIGADLRVRVISGLVMAVAAILSEIAGGWWFALFWTAVFAAAAVEWQHIIGPDQGHRRAMSVAAAVVASGLLIQSGFAFWSFAPLAAAAAICAMLIPEQSRRAAIGVAYGGLPVIALIWLRSAEPLGMELVAWIFGIVWSADIAAYFTGRTLGGPKLWPSVSPKKTWSGFIGGSIGGGVIASLVLMALGVPLSAMVVVVAIGLAVVSAGGDLYESALKRHFGVKDASNLIPGHGGVMDRVDGFIFVLVAAAILALVRGGDPGQALLVW